MPHDHVHDHPRVGHNHADADHLRSHMAGMEVGDDLQALTSQFIAGFREAADKTSFLRVTGIPFEIDCPDGPGLKLVDVVMVTEWQVGTASPAFGSRDLSYLPLPGDLVAERVNLRFVYVSLDERRDIDLRTILAARAGGSQSQFIARQRDSAAATGG